MLGDIDFNKKPVKAAYFLARPNREVISKLSEAYDVELSTKLNDVNELSLTLPVYLDRNHRKAKNPNMDLIREKYLIKEVKNGKSEWYTVNQIENVMDSDKDSKQISCNAYYHSLADKMVTDYDVESKYCRQVLTDILASTLWTIDYIDADFDLTYRSFSFSSTNALEAIYSVAETYNAIVLFDTDKRTVSFQKPELTGINRGLTFSYGKYMKSMNQTYQTDQIVTRLIPTGADGLGIQKVNPTGQAYLEDYSYWMYPFARDENNTTLSSSYWMSDALCHALLDYSALVASKADVFQTYLKRLEGYEEQLKQLELDLNKLQNEQAVVTDTTLSQQFDGKMFFEKYVHADNSSRSFALNATYAFAVMAKIDNGNGMTVRVNGQSFPFTAGQWSLLCKVKDTRSLQVDLSGGNSGVYIQVANISLDEYADSQNMAAIVDRYNPDNKENQIRLKQLEIDDVNAAIAGVKAQTEDLQNQLLADHNFTAGELQELNEFIFEKEFNDDTYIDAQDLYDAAKEKFKEMQKPTLTVSVDIVDFLEIVEEQRNWDKLALGDFVNIKYEPLHIYVEARIVEIAFDYEKSSVSLTLSNAKDVNDESKRIEKFINDAKTTSVVLDANKTKWGQAIVDTSQMSQLFDHFWNKITNDINMASNEYVTIDRKGITITDPNDSLRFLRATHGVLGVTRSGGLKYETAISADGLIAEMVLGKIILGQRVVIGDTTGVFTIEGSTLTIQDRFEREVAKLGLLEESPGAFGFRLNRYANANQADTTIVNRVKMTADEGFLIERIRNGVADKTFGTSLDGDLFVKAGVDDQVFTIDSHGLALGSSVWSQAPFHADYLGNVWMNKLFAESAEITESLFKDGHIVGSDLVLKDNSGGIISMFPAHGLWFGAESPEDAPAWIKMDGTAIFKKLVVTDGEDTLLLDSDKRQLVLNHWDIVGAGAINTELLAANIVSSEFGFISDLTANKLSTLSRQAVTKWTNFINIHENTIDWITGIVTQGAQKKLSDGRPLYWTTSAQTGQMTLEHTEWAVYEFDSSDENKKVKMQAGFRGEGDAATPYIRMGLGDGLTPTSGVALLDKYEGGLKISIGQRNTGDERSIDFSDEGIDIFADGQKVNITSKDFIILADTGIKLTNGAGSTIEMNGDTITFQASNYIFQ